MSHSATKDELLEATMRIAAAHLAAGHRPCDVTARADEYVQTAEALLLAVNKRMDGKAWIELK